MERKLYIINNGLKDLRGHYFETSVSIVEACEEIGLHPVLGAHVSCPTDLVSDNLDFHAVFTTDHWMANPPPPQPQMFGLRGEIAPLLENPIEALRRGRIDFKDYLNARFEVDPEKPNSRSDKQNRPTLSFRARVKPVAKAILPPALTSLYPLAKKTLRLSLPPFVWTRLRAAYRPATACPPAAKMNRVETLLDSVGCRHEHGYMLRFKEDLDRLLSLTGCTSNDHVYLPTAHGRELLRDPAAHGDMAGAVAPDVPSGIPSYSGPGRVGRSQRVSCVLCDAPGVFRRGSRHPEDERLRLYTDTEGLSEEYERFAGLRFGVLPIPFRARLISRPPRKDGRLCISCFGDPREEKGFHWLPDLIDAMMDDYLLPGRAYFLIQASLSHPEHEPRCAATLERLKGYADRYVHLVGLDGPLSPEAYYELVSQSDLALCPYHPIPYRNRSSGTLAEAIAAGIPTIVPGNTWLSRQQPAGSGETFFDQPSFIEAVGRVCLNYDAYRTRSRCRPKPLVGAPFFSEPGPLASWRLRPAGWRPGENCLTGSRFLKDSIDACTSLLQLGVFHAD